VTLFERALGHRAVWAGMLALGAAALFFTWDVVSDVVEHSGAGVGYTPGELVHLVFEILAVGALVFGMHVLRAYLGLLRREAAGRAETIALLRGRFGEVIAARFGAWGLTAAEREVAMFILKGLSTADIAAARNTAPGTVKAQSAAILRKIGVSSRTELMSVFMDEFIDAAPADPVAARAS